MLKTVQARVLFIITIAIFLFFVAQLIRTDLVTTTNSVTFKAHYQNVIQNWVKGSFNYDVLTTEGENYKIAAGYSDCFQYKDFLSNVAPGQLLTIKILKNNKNIFSDIKVITSLEVDGKLYLESSCFNQKLSNQKFFVPFMLLAIIIIFYILLLYEEQKQTGKRKYKR